MLETKSAALRGGFFVLGMERVTGVKMYALLRNFPEFSIFGMVEVFMTIEDYGIQRNLMYYRHCRWFVWFPKVGH